jgi:uncharacterized protein (DUF302 family)
MVNGMHVSGNQMATRSVQVQRITYISRRPFAEVLARLESKIGHPDMSKFSKDVAAASTDEELEQVVHRAVGPADLMEFNRMDFGAVLKKELGPKAPQSVRLLVGNPLIMKQMVKRVPDAGSYAPVTILVDERPDGIHLSYDTMASYLAAYGNPDALKVARDLDSKIEALLAEAAG